MINLIDCGKSEFINRTAGKKLYCFGAGKYFQKFLAYADGVSVEAVIDNYRYKKEPQIEMDGQVVEVISADTFFDICDKRCAVVITCMAIEEVLAQLDAVSVCDGMDCFVEELLENYMEREEIAIENPPGQGVIPRKIHYCWFGGSEMPEEYQRYIASWSKYCPDYEIIRWDESNYDVHKIRYTHEAYEQKKWGFVSDYARVDILNQEGGIYLDTDVEIIAPFDEFLVWDLFCGFEQNHYIAWGLGVGSVKGHPILKSLLDVYENMTFVQEDGSLNLKPCPIIQTEVMEQYGFKRNGKFQARNGVAVFPWEVFAPFHIYECYGRITENTHSIHHYAASWVESDKMMVRKRYEDRIRKIQEHNRIGTQENDYAKRNQNSRIKRFQIWDCIPDTNVAGSKAPADIKKICGENGYQVIPIHPHNGRPGDWSYERNRQDWERCYELIPKDSILLLQHPFWQEQEKRNETLCRLKEEKHVRIISLVHDVEKLRGIFLSEYMQAEYDFMLQIGDVWIVHNERMKEVFLKEDIGSNKLIALGIFDYLSKQNKTGHKAFEKSLSIAGNLDAVKSPYIGKLQELSPLKFHLYGPNYSQAGQEGTEDNILYHGVFPANTVQEQFKGGFGLVWDGEKPDTCAGGTGEYLRYNNPHKLSLYLSAGLPVIIWKEAAEAEFVERTGAGLTVASLYEVKEILDNMTEEQYKGYASAAETIAEQLKRGSYMTAALEKAEQILGKGN